MYVYMNCQKKNKPQNQSTSDPHRLGDEHHMAYGIRGSFLSLLK